MLFTHTVFLDFDELCIEPSSYVPKSSYENYVTSISYMDPIKRFMGVRKREGYKLTARGNYTHALVVF